MQAGAACPSLLMNAVAEQEEKKREDEQMERMLNMDLNASDVGVSPEVQDLENKYTNTKSSGGN